MASWRVLPSETCQYFGVTEEFLYSLILAMQLTSAYLKTFDDMPSDEVNKKPSSAVDGEPHGTGDDSTARDLPLFRCNRGDPIVLDVSLDLSPYFQPFHDTSSVVAATKRTSRL